MSGIADGPGADWGDRGRKAYEVTFKYLATRPIAFDRLRQQVRDQQLGRDPVVVGLGGKEYRAAIEAAFADSPVREGRLRPAPSRDGE